MLLLPPLLKKHGTARSPRGRLNAQLLIALKQPSLAIRRVPQLLETLPFQSIPRAPETFHSLQFSLLEVKMLFSPPGFELLPLRGTCSLAVPVGPHQREYLPE